MPGAGYNGGVERLGLLEHGFRHGEDIRGVAALHGHVAVAAAKGHVVLAGNDVDGASIVARGGGAVGDSQQLAEGGGLAVSGGVLQHIGGEVAGAKKVNMHANGGFGGNVAGDVLLLEAGADGSDGGKIGAEGKEGHVGRGLGEAGENNGVGDVGVFGGEGVGHGGAKRVADVDGAGEVVALEAAEVGIARAEGELVQGLDLESELNLLNGVAMRGLGDAEAVPGEGGVAGIESVGDIRVVVRGKGVVPVGTVKADAVSEDLKSGRRTRGRVADCGGEGVVFVDVGVVL